MKAVLVVLAVLAVVGIGTVQVLAKKRERSAMEHYPPQGILLDVDGVTVHAEQMGQGPDLVLIHGASGNTRDFTFAFADLIKDRYRITILDRPGLGWSDRAGPEYERIWTNAHEDPITQARLLRAATQKLGVENPIVLGHSFGGIVALAWAVEFDDLTGIVSVAGVANPWPGTLDWTYTVGGTAWGGALVIPLLSAFVPQTYVDMIVAGIFKPQKAPEGYLDHVGSAMTLRRNTMRANTRQVNWLRPHVVDLSKRYGEITEPVEIVHGDADTIVPLDVHSIKLPEQIDGANLTVLPGVGHMPHHTHASDVISAIDRVADRAGLR
ncbi:hydrolase or acyltransferase (alpha/beta hydrolase) [Tateyamaria omphalii]|uniref:alpha/beta fold hydrolase n=1 Tax=Tateyamaria omphalii TaxID=299262 RepID=UPI0019ACA574|nr:alpha/beta hydrolase [Tateyamaria omphalii]GGX62087.1 hydrolase or acyltransferase (alpha/beta hydrolase) [Tateyamaria omphalii]